MPRARRPRAATRRSVEIITHEEASRRNLPSAEHQALVKESEASPVRVAYQRRNRDLDPQLVWRGKDEQDLADLVVNAPPLYIQERVHPKALVDDLMRQSRQNRDTEVVGYQHEFADLFADFNGLPSKAARTEFYRHDAHWSNRMVLGDSLQVMASLAEREGLRGQVQCIYIDPPYGIRFNSNFQWSTTDKDVRGNDTSNHISREPEQIKAFRDTWREGVHSYLTYLRDRFTVARELLADSGSILVQMGDENVHRVRAVMDEVFGPENFISLITFKKTQYQESENVSNIADYVLLYAKDKAKNKHRRNFTAPNLLNVDYSKHRRAFTPLGVQLIPQDWRNNPDRIEDGWRPFRSDITLTQDGEASEGQIPWIVEGIEYTPGAGRHWRTHEGGRIRLAKAGRVNPSRSRPFYIESFDDSPTTNSSNIWTENLAGAQGKVYVVQTNERVLERCILMTTDPGDLVLDPTCGSGTTAYVAEQWGRRWITIDTSRVALALARARIMGARYPYYLLADSRDGQLKESELSRRAPSDMTTYGNIRQGFVYERVPHITLRAIANNTEIDVIYEDFQEKVEPLREQLNRALDRNWEEWEIPREAGDPWTGIAAESWHLLQHYDDASDILKLLSNINRALDRDYKSKAEVPGQPRDPWDSAASELHAEWWRLRIERQKEIDASIAARADYEYLYDKPYTDNNKVRVAGPFTVESISPHRVLGVDENGDVLDTIAESRNGYGTGYDFGQIILDNLRRSGLQQAHKEDRITFASLAGWPGRFVCAEGQYVEGASADADEAPAGPEKRAGIFIGPEFGTVSRPDLVEAAREAAEAGFDVLIACAFNYDAHTTEFESLGRIPVLKARMNADLHMAGELKNTGNGNLFVIFGEPDIDVLDAEEGQLRVKVNGVDVFDPSSGEVRSDGPDGIACWFIDTDYNQENFLVRHAYFLGANDPYSSLKTTLKAEIDEDAWATLKSDTSRPFPKPESGRIAVKVINHLGDEVMKVFRFG